MAFDPVSAVFEIGGRLIDRLWPNPEQRDAAKLELVKLQQTGELARMANESETIKAFLADTQSARQRESDIATSGSAPLLNKVISPILALIVVVGGGSLMVWSGNPDVRMAAASLITLVLGYYFGTSQGSTKANQLFRDMAKTKTLTNSHG